MTGLLLSLVYPYYINAGMLAEQYRIWASYSDALKASIEIVLVDDGSPAPHEASAVERPAGLPPLRLYRVLEDRPWHQHGARNLGAREAAAPWLFLSDIDHVLPATSLSALLTRLNYDVVYTFKRLDAPDLEPNLKDGRPHPHPNTVALTKARFWDVGGYDEDLRGYGTDAYFQRRLYAERPPVYLYDVPIVRYPREVIADASTTTLLRKEGRSNQHHAGLRAIVAQKAADGRGPTVLAFPWERVL